MTKLDKKMQKEIEKISQNKAVQKYFDEIKDFLSQKLKEVTIQIVDEIKDDDVSRNFNEELERNFLITISTMQSGCNQIFDNTIRMIENGSFIKMLYGALDLERDTEDENLH